MVILPYVLPGLYLTFLASLLARALRRWWDPVPLRVWGVFAAVLLVLFGPALFLGKVLLPVDILPGLVPAEEMGKPPEGNELQRDLVTQIVPWQAQVRRALKAGEWPLWNDLAGAGMPLLADPQSQALQPLVLLALPLPLPQAIGVTAGLRVLLALVFFFLLLRRQGLSEEASLFGSLAFSLGGFLLLWLSWPIGNSPALLPLVLYALVMTADRSARRDFLLLTVAVAALLVGGHPETILHVAAVGILFASSRLLRRPPRDRPRLLARWALAAGIALGLAAPALVPAMRFLPQTHRAHLVELRNERLEDRSTLAGWRTAAERRRTFEGIEERLVPVFAPNAFGNSRWGEYWGEANTNEDASGFVGGAALLAALLAFLPAARRFAEERLFLALAAASLLISIRVPGVPQILSAVPLLNQAISAHRRLLLVAAFSLAYAAACAVERWRRGEGPGRGVIAAGAAILLALITWGHLLSRDVEPLLALRRFWMGLQLATVATTAVILLVQRSPSWSETSRSGKKDDKDSKDRKDKEAHPNGTGPGSPCSPLGPFILAALAAAELLILHRPANPSLPREGFYPALPAIRFLQANAGGFRVAGLGDRLLPNSAAVYGLADVRISNPFKPFSYVQAVAPVSASLRATGHRLIEAEHPLYELLGVRYIIAPPKTRSRPGWRAVFRDHSARIFRRDNVLPRLFLPGSAEGSAISALALRPAHVAARLLLAEDRLLASSIYQDGGWCLLLDGRRRAATTANGPFVAAWLPAGEHRADLLYRAPGLILGLALAAAAVAGLVLRSISPPGQKGVALEGDAGSCNAALSALA